jgi:hypothetical protein
VIANGFVGKRDESKAARVGRHVVVHDNTVQNFAVLFKKGSKLSTRHCRRQQE